MVQSVRAQAKELGVEVSELIEHLSATPARRGRPGRVIVDSGAPGGAATNGRRKKRSNSLKGKKLQPWFRLKDGTTWTGRGTARREIRDYVLGGGKLADVLVDKTKADEARRIEAKIKGQRGTTGAVRSTKKKTR